MFGFRSVGELLALAVLLAVLLTEIALVRAMRDAVRELRQLRQDIPHLLALGALAIFGRELVNLFTSRKRGK